MLEAGETLYSWGHPSMLVSPDICDLWVVLVPEQGSGDPVWQSTVTPRLGQVSGACRQTEGLPRSWLTASTKTFRGEQDYFYTSLLNYKARVTAGEPRDALFTWASMQGAHMGAHMGAHSLPSVCWMG